MWWVLLRELWLTGGKGLLPSVFSSSSHSDGLQLLLYLTVENKMSHFEFIKQLCKGGGTVERESCFTTVKYRGEIHIFIAENTQKRQSL